MRLYLTNTANTRVFNVALPGARMKLVGGDSGRCEREELVESVVLAPSERAVVDVLFDDGRGRLALEHRTPERSYPLAAIAVGAEPPCRHIASVRGAAQRSRAPLPSASGSAPVLGAEPDKTLAFVAEMDMAAPEGEGPIVYACPMHPEVVREPPSAARSAA